MTNEQRIAALEAEVRRMQDDGGLDMTEELRSVMRWEEKRMGAVSMGVLKSVIARMERLAALSKEAGHESS